MKPSPRGQTLVLFALTMLLMVLMVCITLSISARAKRKLELQTLAETAAYSNAVATARTYNTASLLNRTMVSHWVAMAGVHGLVAWATDVNRIFGQLGGMVREFEAENRANAPGCDFSGPKNNMGKIGWYACPEAYDPGPGSCTDSTWAIRDASYELWHVALSLYRPRNGPRAGDDVNSGCLRGVCSGGRSWMPVGWGELDAQVGQQVKDLHRSITALGLIQYRTYDNLERVLDDGRMTGQLVNLSQGRDPSRVRLPRGYRLEGGLGGEDTQVAWREAGRRGANFKESTHDRVMAEAVLGTRGANFLIWHQQLPRRVRREINVVKASLDRNWPGSFNFGVMSGVLNTYPSKDPTNALSPIFPWEDNALGRIGWGSLVGISRGPGDAETSTQLTATFRPPAGCSRPPPQTVYGHTSVKLQTNDRDDDHHQWGHGRETATHARHPMTDMYTGAEMTTCHDYHVHYDERDDGDVHLLDAIPERIKRGNSILPGLGFVFPQNRNKDGANGAYGQPKLPVMLVREDDAFAPDPWDLTFKLRVSRGGDRVGIDMQDRRRIDDMTALAAGMAYYHRRGGWVEGPNMLNPFWRAALVPIAVDERSRGNRRDQDPTRYGNRQDVPSMLRSAGHRQQARAYEAMVGQYRGFKGFGDQ